jgi:hypothetical protein
MAKGGFSAPLLDYAFNTLASAEPGAIIFTNGDNDTYPPLALQATYGTRKDVAIVNLSLLGVEKYALSVWEETLERGPFTKQELEGLWKNWKKETKGEGNFVPFSHSLLPALQDKVGRGEWKAPVYFAITVAPPTLESCDRRLVLEGLLYRMMTEPTPAAEEEPGVNAAKTQRLFRETFRLDSATDLAFPWESHGAVARLMMNYPAVLRLLALDASGKGDQDAVAASLSQAIRILDFHGEDDMVIKLAQYWKKLDPQSHAMDSWLEK